MSDHHHHQHTIHREHIHHGWNNAFAPKLKIAPGETVQFETLTHRPGNSTRLPPRPILPSSTWGA